MAIDERLLTLTGMGEVVKEGYAAYEQLTGLSKEANTEELIRQTIGKLENYLSIIEGTEKIILEAFDIKGTNSITGQSLLRHLFENFYQQSGLHSFSGSELRQKVLNYYKATIDKENRELINFLNGPFIQDIANTYGEKIKKDPKLMKKTILTILKNAGFEGTKTSTGGTKVIYHIDDNGSGYIDISELSPNRRDILKIIKKNGFETEIDGKKIEIKSGQSNINSFQISSKTIIDYGTEGFTSLSKDELELRFKQHPKDKQKMINILIQEISKVFPKENINTDEYKGYLKELVTEENLVNFLAGENINNITGILGEIGAYIALKSLISDKYRDKIKWIANEIKDDKKLSIDFIIEELGIGIQVKNTTRDVDKIKQDKDVLKGLEIGFADAAIETIFERLQQMGLNIDINAIKNVYTSSEFNVPYKYNTKKEGKTRYIQIGVQKSPYSTTSKNEKIKEYIAIKNANFNKFIGTYEAEKRLIEKINIFFAAFAPHFLFMGVKDQNFNNTLINLSNDVREISNGNNLYLIAGVPILASTILTGIIEDLNRLHTLVQFKLQASLGKTPKDFFNSGEGKVATIVDYKNNTSMSKEDKITYLKNTSVKFTSGYIFNEF